MKPRDLLLLTAAAWALAAAPAPAHYLFVRVLPPAEAGRFAEVYFSEQAEAGDPRFTDKIAHTQLWLQTEPGKFRPLKTHKAEDRLRAAVPPSGGLAVVGACEYGVLGRPDRPAFLLRHYPKAVAGGADDLNALRPCDQVPLEIVAAFDGERVTFTALRKGKPLPGAVLNYIDQELKGDKLTAGDDGRAAWKPPAPGRYSVYTQFNNKESGEAGGKKYQEIREFATLAFTWPLERKGADPKAVALFEDAIAARASWKDFPGFAARVEGQMDGRRFKGKVTVDAVGKASVETDDEVVDPWVKDQLESIAMHRRPESSDRPKPVLRFADDEADHPLGRLLTFEGGRFASSYRVKDKQNAVVNRHVGKQHFTITVLDNDRNREGLFLPRTYTVQYWDAETGTLRRTETVQERWARVGAWDLPSAHTVTLATESGLAVRGFTLNKHELLKVK